MANLGLPVPPGFTITTALCTHYYANAQKYPKDLEKQVDAGLAHIARVTGRRFGDRANPLLVSVRSGARASMPGMMDTVLNLGLNDDTVEALAQQSGDRRFAYDSTGASSGCVQRGARHRASQPRRTSGGPQVARRLRMTRS
jgi:pyruvate,orthophosphate dikinase